VFFDALRVKIRNEGLVSNRAVYLAIGLRCSGRKEILGLWLEQTEGAKFWLRVMSELRNRGVQDILIAVVDGLKGFPEAITSVFPKTVVQTCIVHLLRYAMQFASWKEHRALAAHSGRSIRPSRPRWHASGWRILTAARGAKNTRPSRTAGGATGSR
jgi:putative transposase